MKHMIVVSPIPSHPQFQGNSARIFRLTKMYQLAGYKVHFVYFGMEGLSAQQQINMKNCWDFFYFVQPQGPAALPSFDSHFDIDDWYDNRVSDTVEKICRRYKIDICITNYVWFSKVLDAVPKTTQKIIDTHDVFGDRHLVALAAGLQPVWFYTTKELESFALSRADLVFAIQDEEKEYFESITDTPVEVLGYVVPNHQLLETEYDDQQKIKIGYIGSGNPFNAQSLIELQKQILLKPEVLNYFEFIVAGTICNSIAEQNQVFELFGMVDELEDFYAEIDIAINPMVGGTGLKIKSLEALSFGKPLLGTLDAMVGIPTTSKYQTCSSVEALISMLLELDKDEFVSLKVESAYVFMRYNQRHIETFNTLFKY
jgi:glycosyltransferase involved in cell wall biosynthesis